MAFDDAYDGRTVLLTGHTGFKGAWLAHWLGDLGATVVGLSTEPPSEPSMHDLLGVPDHVTDVRGDIRDAGLVAEVVAEHRPSVVLHLAAEAIVRRGYEAPLDMFSTNVMGTAKVLDAALRAPSVEAVVVVTTDKVYDNVEWPWGYRENDRLGGKDPYSASKAGAELVVRSYQHEPLQAHVARETGDPDRRLPIAAARAGNVIGGGDWAAARIVPDLVRAVAAGEDLVLRNPDAVRPWQHVLEPLSGYLHLCARLLAEPSAVGPAYNFGPPLDTDATTVGDLTGRLLAAWGDAGVGVRVERDTSAKESHFLTLDSTLARTELAWRPAWRLDACVAATAAWYRAHHAGADAEQLRALTTEQVQAYTAAARASDVAWSR